MISRQVKNNSRYSRIENELRCAILQGVYPENVAMPSELALCKQYTMCRKTIRKALENLRAQNFIRKQKGSGSFVIPAEERLKMRRITGKIRVMIPQSPEMSDFEREAIAGVQKFAIMNDLEVSYGSHSTATIKLIEDYHNFIVDAFIWCCYNTDSNEKITELGRFRIPQVMIDREIDGVAAVIYDSLPAWKTLLNMLYSQGHRNIAFIERTDDTEWALSRQAAFIQACTGQKCNPTIFRTNLLEIEKLRQFAEDPNGITAYICIGPFFPDFLRILKSLGKKIPEDVSLIEFTPDSLDPGSNITRIHIPVMNMAAEAASLLTTLDFRNGVKGETISIPCYTIAGMTTGVCANKEGIVK